MGQYLIIFLVGPLLGFLIGGIPFGVILTAARGIDIRTIGSGNIGATNVARALGRRWGYFCFGLDVLKGALPTALMGLVIHRFELSGSALGVFCWALVGCAAVLGHVFPIYLKFKGGKGVATSAGVTLAIWPFFTIPALFALLAWLIVTLASKTVSAGSLAACLAFLIGYLAGFWIFPHDRWIIPAWSLQNHWPLLLFACLITLLIIIRHRANITRLLTGREHQIKLGQEKSQ